MGEICLPSLERDRVANARPIGAKEVPLVDRIEEMKLLKEAVDRTIRGEGGLVFLYGEAGIGKTRLARELRAYARLHGMRVLYGRCPALFRMDGVLPYVLWSEVIRDYLDNSSLEQLYRVIGFYPAEVAKLVPELVQKLRAIPQSFPISPEQEQNRLFEAVSQFITNISREAPLLLVLDDLQWTDPSSLLLLHYLARGVQKTPLLLLGAYRSTDIDAKHPLSPVLTELNREGLPESIHLKRMSLSDVSEMIKGILGQEDVPSEFCKLVYEKTAGNPFFVGEVVKSLKEEEAIYREANKWKIKEVTKIEFPETVKSVMKARIGRLDDEQQNVLTMASLVGNDFTFEALQAVTGSNEDKLRKIVDGLLKTGLLKHREVRGEDVCSFADIILRNVVYEEVGTYERKKLHGIVGTTLEKVYAAKIDEHYGELASHFLEGGDKDKALGYFLKAADKAAKIYANSEAASYCQSALRLLEEKESDIQEKARVLDRLGDIKKLLGEYNACIKYWNEALQLFKQLGEKERVARLHRKTASVLWSIQGDAEKAKTHHDEALKILQNEPETAELGSLFEDMACLYLRTDVAKARSWGEKAVELAEKLKDYEVIANSFLTVGSAIGQTGAPTDREKAVVYGEKALRIALDNGLMDAALRAYSHLGDYATEEGFKLYEKGYEHAKKVGDVSWVSAFGTNLADAYAGMGDMNKSVSLMEESVALDRKAGDVNQLSYALDELGWSYGVLGEWEKCEQHFKEALSLGQKAQNNMRVAYTFWSIGWFYGFQKGEFVKAKEQFEKALEIYERTGAESSARFIKGFIIWACIELGEIEKAKNLLNKLPKSSSKVRRDYWVLATENLLWGMLFRAQKNWKESITFFEKWLQDFEAFGARRWNVYWFAVYLCEYACVYLDRDQEGDRKRAHDLLSQALEIFQKMGAKKDVEKTMKLMEVLHPPRIQTPEKTVSPTSYVCDEMRCNIVATPKEMKIGESLELEMELINTRKEGAILLTKITEVVPEGFAVAKKPEFYRMEDNCLNMKEKRLGPQETEIVKLVLTPKVQGTFRINPKIVYLDENGKRKTFEPKPVNIMVKELGIKGWLKGER
jgi:tetratricopeptide (TPR) repeat protein